MPDRNSELTELERRIADELGNVMDMCSRLITGPVSKSYFLEKFSNLARSAGRVVDLAQIEPDGDWTPGIAAPDWDPEKVWDAVVQQYSLAGGSLDQVWAGLEHENPQYIAVSRNSRRSS